MSGNLNIVAAVVVVTVVMVVLTHNQKQGTAVERLLLEIHSAVVVAGGVSWYKKVFNVITIEVFIVVHKKVGLRQKGTS